MIISEKQIMQLLSITNHYIELISLISMEGIQMNYPEEHRENASKLLAHINDQQSEELKVIE